MAVQLVYETHATTYDNENGIATGWLPGELSPTGVANARDLGRRRRDDGIDLVLSSDLARAVRTVEIAFGGSDLPCRTDPRLRECDYGQLNGAPVDVVHAERPARVDVPYPGGQSYRQVTEGVRGLLDELSRDHDGQRVLLVGHAATRFALDHLLAGRPLQSAVAGPFAWRPGWEYVADGTYAASDVLGPDQTLAIADQLTSVYEQAFCIPPYDETPDDVRRFADEQLPTHAAREGFRCTVVRRGTEPVGFAYAYTGRSGQWWTDRITAQVSDDLERDWVGGHLEVVELAVTPSQQRHGLGAALMDLVLHPFAGEQHSRALLTTWAGDRPAPRLFARTGWQLLARGVLDGSRDLWGRRL